MNPSGARAAQFSATGRASFTADSADESRSALEVDGGNLSSAEFERVARLLYDVCRINLQAGKEQLVKARLWKRVRAVGLRSFQEYLELVEDSAGRSELAVMVDALTTNKTSFFRESQHFDFLRGKLELLAQQNPFLRIWCAGCSTGQEPYSLAMTLLEAQGSRLFRDMAILATDISARVLEEAGRASYDEFEVREIPPPLLKRYFLSRRGHGEPPYEADGALRSLISFARLNLMEHWPMNGPFDVIFCRNVMIYFDKPTQHNLVDRFRRILRPGGYLFVGHSESLAGRGEGYAYVVPAVYQKLVEGNENGG